MVSPKRVTSTSVMPVHPWGGKEAVADLVIPVRDGTAAPEEDAVELKVMCWLEADRSPNSCLCRAGWVSASGEMHGSCHAVVDGARRHGVAQLAPLATAFFPGCRERLVAWAVGHQRDWAIALVGVPPAVGTEDRDGPTELDNCPVNFCPEGGSSDSMVLGLLGLRGTVQSLAGARSDASSSGRMSGQASPAASAGAGSWP